MNDLLKDENLLRQYFGEGMSQRMMDMHLLDRADEEISRITIICDGLTEYFLKRLKFLKEDIAVSSANDDSLAGQGMRTYLEVLIVKEAMLMNATVSKVRSVGLGMMTDFFMKDNQDCIDNYVKKYISNSGNIDLSGFEGADGLEDDQDDQDDQDDDL